MKGRERNKGAPPADLLVCFPTRSHLKLMPKPTTCSPSRPSEPTKRFLQHHHLRKSATNTSMLLLKNKHMESDMSEPTSPKVTCAGQIKVRPKTGGSCKNWQSVMEEIEKLHNHNKKNKKIKKPNWVEALGFKKDVMQFLTCLRTIRFDFRCFGSFPSVDITSSDDEDDDDEDDEEEKDNAGDGKCEQNQEEDDENENSKAVFSKWFMVLQENQDTKEGLIPTCDDQDHHQSANNVPPSNALLLMRCRSAPAKSWLEEREEDNDEEEEEEEEKKAEMVNNEEEVKRKKILDENNLVVMEYDTDFYKLSCDIAKETWVVGGINKDQMSRSRSCKR